MLPTDHHRDRRPNRNHLFLPIAIIAIGVTLTTALFLFARYRETEHLKTEFVLRSSDRAEVIKNSITDNIAALFAVRDFFDASETITPAEFSAFTRPILARRPSILDINWIPKVTIAELALYEAGAPTIGIDRFRITELDQDTIVVAELKRDTYFPIYYTEPLENEKFIIGFDIASDPTRRAAMEEARDRNEPVATGRIHLVGKEGADLGCRIFLPVYRHGAPRQTTAERRDSLTGFVSFAFRIGAIIETSLADLRPAGINIRLLDRTNPSAEQMLYYHPSRTAASPRQDGPRRTLVWSAAFTVGGRAWTILCDPDPAFIRKYRGWQPWGILAIGFLLTGILALYLFEILNRAAAIEKLVAEKTDALRTANRVLEEESARRQTTTEALQVSETRYRELVECANSIIIKFDRAGTITFVNEFAQAFFGYRADELIGKNVIGTITPRIDSAGADLEALTRQIIADPERYRIHENENICRNGRRVWISWTNRVIENGAGKAAGILSVGNDITTRKLYEITIRNANEEWQRTFDSITDILFIQDIDSVIVKANKTFAALFGTTPERIVGKKCYEIIHRGDRPWPNCPFEKTKSDRRAHTEEVEDSNIGIPLLVTTSPIFDTDGKLIGSVHLAKDITAMKKAKQKLKEAIALKTHFTSVVSHELRTPLTAIKEGINLVFDGSIGAISDEQKEFLGIAQRNVDRLARLINDVLDFQKLEAGRVEFFMQGHDINKVVTETAESIVPLASKKGLELILELDEGIPKVWFDKDKITQVLVNLFMNAVRFTEHGSITVATEHIDNLVHVTVADTGPGIPPDDLPRLFVSFEQLASASDRKTGGTGLGLAISREIIKQHNGKIWAESELNKGTRFIFTLPVTERKA